MLSRVADSLVLDEPLSRASRAHGPLDRRGLSVAAGPVSGGGSGRWWRLLEALQAPVPEDGKIDATTLTHILTLDKTNSSSIVSCVAAARENLRQVREQCSSAMWEQLNRLYLQVNSTTAGEAWLLHSMYFFARCGMARTCFIGVTDSTMSHGEGWQYIQLGRFVERTDAVARLIGAYFSRLPIPPDSDQAVESEGISGVGGIAEILRCV
jgi:uncharacterized alpha-E superfamily protein